MDIDDKIAQACETIVARGSDTQKDDLEDLGERLYNPGAEERPDRHDAYTMAKGIIEMARKGPVTFYEVPDRWDVTEDYSLYLFEGTEEQLYEALCNIMPELSQLVLGGGKKQ